MNTIDHQKDHNRFVLAKENHECLLDYKITSGSDNTIIDFNNTYVPFALRGKGLAEELVNSGLAWAKEQGYQIEASCWYVRDVIGKNDAR